MRTEPTIYGRACVGVAITDLTENWLRLFAEWIADNEPENENGR
jgi:hypothetical protein